MVKSGKVGNFIYLKSYHNSCYVTSFEARDGKVQRFLHAIINSLADQAVEVNGSAEELDMTLSQQRDVSVGWWGVDKGPQVLALLSEAFVQHDATSQVLVVAINLFAQLVNKLVEAQVDLGLDFIVEKLLLKHSERVVSTVVIQVQWVKHALHVRRVFGRENVVC